MLFVEICMTSLWAQRCFDTGYSDLEFYRNWIWNPELAISWYLDIMDILNFLNILDIQIILNVINMLARVTSNDIMNTQLVMISLSFPTEVKVSLHPKKFRQSHCLWPYLLTDFFDLKSANSSTESTVQRWHRQLYPSHSVQPVPSVIARTFLSLSSGERKW